MSSSAGPLAGKTVAITRPMHQCKEMVEIVETMGGTAYVAPMIEITAPKGEELAEFIRKTASGCFDKLVFLSVNSIRCIFEEAQREGKLDLLLKGINASGVLVIGTRTQRELVGHGVTDNVVARIQSTDGVLEAIGGELKGLHIGIPRSSMANSELGDALKVRGAQVTEVTAYISRPPADRSRAIELIRDLEAGKVDAVTFTSASTATNLAEIAEQENLLGQLKEGLGRTIVAAIGPRAKGAIEALGFKVNIVPEKHSIRDLVEALVSNLE
ncbi:uroporphyrinogen-III synthase [Candidatus Bathyarchaeota archaeon]|nr:uroporphyrinogen-III synthase [Candidatus Bathyarchaeota archaeon]